MRAAIIAGTRSKNNHILNLQDNNNNNNNNNNQNSNNSSNADSHSTTSGLDATPTSSRPRPRTPAATPPPRPPLRARDRNAMMRAAPSKASTPLTAKSGNANANANMPPYDHKSNASRPLMPTLSASTKAPHRPAITPRVAGSTATTPSANTTPLPLSRRTPRAGGGGGGCGDVDTPTTTASKEDLSTPVSAFLNHNITPRSGSRKSRVDSANTTPTGTPNGTSVAPSAIESPRVAYDTPSHGPGLGISGMDKDLPKRPTVSFNTTAPEGGGYPKNSTSSTTADSKFFFASDARSAPPPRPVIQAKTPATFFYANGESIPPPTQSSGSSAVGSNVGEERGQPKFFHANGTPDIQLSPSPYFTPPRPGSAVSSSSRITASRAPTSSPSTLSPPQRPLSPSKLSQQASVPSLRNTPPLPSPVVHGPQTGGRAQAANNPVAARRASIEIPSKTSGHGRSESAGSIGSPLRKVSGGSSVDTGPPSTPLHLTTTDLVSTPEEASDSGSKDEIPPALPQSPIKSGQSIEQLNELAANARRERKVLDLEITNSSLSAINRTLEREMRKQTAELRRYRRLSRSGRLSIATSTSLRSSTGTLSSIGGSAEGNGLSDMSEEDEESDVSDDETDSMDDGSLSPAAIAESDLRHLKKDEKRLQLDLSKHQQLLIDSQKMNQGLKRCLEWTETLISEGKRALEYHVRVSDVELGGRVLAPDEVEDNEGMSDIGPRLLREARSTVANKIAPWGAIGRDDRDSGIEIVGAQKEAVVPPPLPQ